MRWVIMNYQNEMTGKPSLGQQSGGRFSIGTRQNGAALVTGLIFLVILTLLGVTAMQTSIMEERMAGNARDRNIAFQAAEAALRNAEADIFGAFAARLPGMGAICIKQTQWDVGVRHLAAYAAQAFRCARPVWCQASVLHTNTRPLRLRLRAKGFARAVS